MNVTKIEISMDTPESDQFCAWLIGQGYDASIGNTTGNFIDGVWTSTDENANQAMNNLWTEYCNS